MINSEVAYQMAVCYAKSCTQLNQEEFCKLLSKNVELKHITNEQLVADLKGYKAVVDCYAKNLFNSTVTIALEECNIESFELSSTIKFVTTATKKENNAFITLSFKDFTILTFVEEEGNYKIGKIFSNVKKNLIS